MTNSWLHVSMLARGDRRYWSERKRFQDMRSNSQGRNTFGAIVLSQIFESTAGARQFNTSVADHGGESSIVPQKLVSKLKSFQDSGTVCSLHAPRRAFSFCLCSLEYPQSREISYSWNLSSFVPFYPLSSTSDGRQLPEHFPGVEGLPAQVIMSSRMHTSDKGVPGHFQIYRRAEPPLPERAQPCEDDSMWLTGLWTKILQSGYLTNHEIEHQSDAEDTVPSISGAIASARMVV
ncbi:hypothetical protein BJ166DRAFT_578584 [Pestalotiopsis sp. NC0098]|nr:hypothetical protein BJ166DRAFT_578584 [Pestalotiopsis sp. NC0098]